MEKDREAVVRMAINAITDVISEPAYELTLNEMVSVLFTHLNVFIQATVSLHPELSVPLAGGVQQLLATCLTPAKPGN